MLIYGCRHDDYEYDIDRDKFMGTIFLLSELYTVVLFS